MADPQALEPVITDRVRSALWAWFKERRALVGDTSTGLAPTTRELIEACAESQTKFVCLVPEVTAPIHLQR